MRPLTASNLLALWERGLPRHALDRSALLCAWARPDLSAQAVADLPLGELTRTLLQLHEASFGARIQGHVDCASCGQRLSLDLQVGDLLRSGQADGRGEVERHGLRLRAPCLRDLAAVARVRQAGEAARQLLARCTLHGEVGTLDPVVLHDLEDALEALDPDADLTLALDCAACGRPQVIQLDPGELLWEQVEAHGRALLSEVHRLACAYGWTESEIMALSAPRRAAYLAMVDT